MVAANQVEVRLVLTATIEFPVELLGLRSWSAVRRRRREIIWRRQLARRRRRQLPAPEQR